VAQIRRSSAIRRSHADAPLNPRLVDIGTRALHSLNSREVDAVWREAMFKPKIAQDLSTVVRNKGATGLQLRRLQLPGYGRGAGCNARAVKRALGIWARDSLISEVRRAMPGQPALARRASHLTARVDNVVICGRTLTRSILSPVELPVQAGFHDTLCLANADVRKRAQNGREGKRIRSKAIIIVFEESG
jgi:hypothetical protein